jgi:hypothetical protein
MIKITGNTYPVKAELKELGGRWNAAQKCWMVPDEVADVARALVAEAPARRTFHRHDFDAEEPYQCCADCGKYSKGFYRCWDCNRAWRMNR